MKCFLCHIQEVHLTMLFLFCPLIISTKTYLGGYTKWSRDGADYITMTNSSDDSYHIKHTGIKDFSITSKGWFSFIPGDKVEIGVDFTVKSGSATISCVVKDSHDHVISYSLGLNSTKKTNQLEHVKSKFFIPDSTYSVNLHSKAFTLRKLTT